MFMAEVGNHQIIQEMFLTYFFLTSSLDSQEKVRLSGQKVFNRGWPKGIRGKWASNMPEYDIVLFLGNSCFIMLVTSKKQRLSLYICDNNLFGLECIGKHSMQQNFWASHYWRMSLRSVDCWALLVFCAGSIFPILDPAIIGLKQDSDYTLRYIYCYCENSISTKSGFT